MEKSRFLSFFLIFLFLEAINLNGQIVFKEIQNYKINSNDSLFFDITSQRKIIPLDGKWEVYKANDDEKVKSIVSVPSAFKGEGEVVFEKKIYLDRELVSNNKLVLVFFGLNYSADISINNKIIYRHSGGELPFQIPIPRDIIKEGKNNILRVKLNYLIDAENTIPVKQRFLFPTSYGGILKDVYIHVTPNVSITENNISAIYMPSLNRAKIKFDYKLENESRLYSDSSSNGDFTVKIKLYNQNGSSVVDNDQVVNVPYNREKEIKTDFEISSPTLWSPQSPAYYVVVIEIYKKDVLIDRTKKSLCIFSLVPNSEGMLLNGSAFTLSGVTYVPQFGENSEVASYDKMEDDIRLIKEAGFNSVRFIKSIPHPYYLRLCEKYGLIAFVEVPFYSIPPAISSNANFLERSRTYVNLFLKAFKNYSSIAGIGIGNGYLSNNDNHVAFLKELSQIIKNSTNKLVYASFSNFENAIDGIDMYGVDIINQFVSQNSGYIQKLQDRFGKGKVFISSATYVVNSGNSNGYSNPYSFEAQAKFYEDLLEYSEKNELAGYFINSMFDYRGDYSSLIAGYSSNNLYCIGLLGEDRALDRLGYKVVSAKLHNLEKVTIPIGSKKESVPMVFIVFGIGLAILLGILVNSGRKFREDSSRALLRPYNFYADVRDQRIMSSFHTTFLAIVISAVSALMLSNILYYYKGNAGVENLLLSFGSTKIMTFFSYLSWHPVPSLIILTILSLVALLVITLAIKIGSMFIRNRVYISGIYYSVVWSFLPLVLLIPLAIVLYRIFDSGLPNIYTIMAMVLFTVWIFYRLMKGIYVIFDVNAGSVYFYSILVIVFIAGGFLFYFQLNNSVIDYVLLTLKQYNIFG